MDIIIDGSRGEGGGQVLRTALTLSLVTGKPFRLENIRGGRAKPGLQRQHLACVLAAVQVSGARVSGAELQSTALEFAPGAVVPGDYRFAVGSAGSAALVVQTILLPLALTGGPSKVTVEGGTHNDMAPSFDFLDQGFAPPVGLMGVEASFTLERPGFYPAGGGVMGVALPGVRTLRWVDLRDVRVLALEAEALFCGLAKGVALAELAVVGRELGLPPQAMKAREVSSAGPGNVLTVKVLTPDGACVFTGFGRRGVTAERVAHGVAAGVKRFLAAVVRVDAALQDQLLLPLALGKGGVFSTLEPTLHTRTNAEILGLFLPVRIDLVERGPDRWDIEVIP